jgi:predicted RNase H-like nuclease
MRCYRLLSRLQPQPVDRTGAGRVVEVYPAAALLRWLGDDLPGGIVPSYKDTKPGRREAREQIFTALTDNTVAVLDLTAEFRDRCIDSDDVPDALVCALIARAADIRLVDEIPDGSRWAASREGWITLPTPDSLSTLA